MQKTRYAIIGVGGVGGYYGAKLINAGHDVHLLLKSDYEHVRENGLLMESPEGNIRIEKVNAYKNPTDMPICDIVLVALKTTSNDQLANILPHICDTNTAIVLMQNGLGFEEKVWQLGITQKIIGGLCFICSAKSSPGHIKHVDYGKVNFAAYSPTGESAGITPEMQKLFEDFEHAKIPVEISDDLVLARWKKLLWNIPFNGLSVLLDTSTDQLLKHTSTRKLVCDLMQEVRAAALANSRNIPQSFMDKMLADTEKMVPYKPSMKLDFESRKPLEIEAIYSNPLTFAMRAGAIMPKTEMLCESLEFLDSRNRAV